MANIELVDPDKEKVDQFRVNEQIDILLNDLNKRLSFLMYTLGLSDEAKKFVAEKSFDLQFGIGPLHKAIQKYLEDPLAEFILNENPAEGAVLEAVMHENGEELKITLAKEVNTDVKE